MDLNYDRLVHLGARVEQQEERIRQMEKHIHYPHNEEEKVMTDAQINSSLDRLSDNFVGVYDRLRQLEKHIHYQHSEQQPNANWQTCLTEAAAKAQAQAFYRDPTIPNPDAVPMRTDVETIRTLTAFAKRLLNTEDFGHAVTFEVRQAARRALGLPEVKEYDL